MNDYSPGEVLYMAAVRRGVPTVVSVQYHGHAVPPTDPDDPRARHLTVRRPSGVGFLYDDVPPECLFKSESDAWAYARGLK